jgi:hypothetical protein
MGWRPLGSRWINRIERATGLSIVWANGHGGYDFVFTTADHRHGVINKVTLAWEYVEKCPQFTSCSRLFPEGVAKGPLS